MQQIQSNCLKCFHPCLVPVHLQATACKSTGTVNTVALREIISARKFILVNNQTEQQTKDQTGTQLIKQERITRKPERKNNRKDS